MDDHRRPEPPREDADPGATRGHASHEGHRERLKERVIRDGLDGLAPHEVIEFFLMFGIPRRDVNPLAHELLRRFGSLSGVLAADYADLAKAQGMTRGAALLLSALSHIPRAEAYEELRSRPTLANWREAGQLALSLFSGRRYETFMLICMDRRSRVLATPIVSEGTLGEAAVYPRLIVESAIRCGAACIVMVHNHPAGTPHFSHEDLRATQVIRDLSAPLNLALQDHILIVGNGYISMKREQILDHIDAILSAHPVPGSSSADTGGRQISEKKLRVPGIGAVIAIAEGCAPGEDLWARRVIGETPP